MIWATVSSRSCFCWLYRTSPSLAANNIINLILYWVRSVQRQCVWKKKIFSLFSVTSDSLRKIRLWCTVMFVRWTEKEVWEGEVRTQQRVPGCSPGSWGQTRLPCPLLVSLSSWKDLQPQGGGCLLGGEVNVIVPSFQVFNFELSPEDMKAIDGIHRNIRYNEILL